MIYCNYEKYDLDYIVTKHKINSALLATFLFHDLLFVHSLHFYQHFSMRNDKDIKICIEVILPPMNVESRILESRIFFLYLLAIKPIHDLTKKLFFAINNKNYKLSMQGILQRKNVTCQMRHEK